MSERFDRSLGMDRGITRRDSEICPFPPLRVVFTEKPPAMSLFKGQKSLKLVTHCRPAESFQQYLLLNPLLLPQIRQRAGAARMLVILDEALFLTTAVSRRFTRAVWQRSGLDEFVVAEGDGDVVGFAWFSERGVSVAAGGRAA